MSSPVLAISVGNSRIHLGLLEGGQVQQSDRFAVHDLAPILDRVGQWWRQGQGDRPHAGAKHPAGEPVILLASVNDAVAERLASALADQLSTDVYWIGKDVPVPIGMQLDPETLTGVDRLLNAAAAYDRVKQACVIVDAGTAVTVDFVDGQGTFHGGAIAPGAGLQLRALHEHTAALPELAFKPPEQEAFGRNTAQAMYQGVFHGIRGLVQRLVERYAEAYGAFPMVIATGGDAQALFENEQLVDRIVPDLTLMGIAAAARHALDEDDDEPKSVRPPLKASRIPRRPLPQDDQI